MTNVQEIACKKIIHGTAKAEPAVGVGSGLLSKVTLGMAGLAKRQRPLATLKSKWLSNSEMFLKEKLLIPLQKEF